MQHDVKHLSASEFEQAASRVAGFIAAYWQGLEAQPQATRVMSDAMPGDVLRGLPERAPEAGTALDEVGIEALLDEVRRVIMPGITHWQHPSFFAFFPANASYPAMLGELLAAGLGVQGMLWATSPACTELETRVLDWLGAALNLPANMMSSASGGGVIQGTASEAVVAAMVAARWRLKRRSGLDRHAKRTVYTSEQAHSSIVKAAMITGFAEDADDRECVRLIGVDDACRMRVDALREAIARDIREGSHPCFVSCSVGTTGTTAIDDVSQVVKAVRELSPDAWVHVDAAHAGAACVCPEYQHWLEGLDGADSFCMNPHKWLLTNFDCDCFWTSDRASLTASMSISPAYLRNQQSDAGAVIDYRDWHVPLGRRFRALKLWLVMKHYGLQGLRAFIRGHLQLASELEAWVRADARWEVVAARTMNLVCIAVASKEGEALTARNERTKAVMDSVNASGAAYCTHTLVPLKGEKVLAIRIAIGATLTQREHVLGVWRAIKEAEQNGGGAR